MVRHCVVLPPCPQPLHHLPQVLPLEPSHLVVTLRSVTRPCRVHAFSALESPGHWRGWRSPSILAGQTTDRVNGWGGGRHYAGSSSDLQEGRLLGCCLHSHIHHHHASYGLADEVPAGRGRGGRGDWLQPWQTRPGVFLKHFGAIFIGDHKAFSLAVMRQIDCEEAGVQVDKRGNIVVDWLQNCTVGDMAGKALLTPVAISAGRRLTRRLLMGSPSCVWTTPTFPASCSPTLPSAPCFMI